MEYRDAVLAGIPLALVALFVVCVTVYLIRRQPLRRHRRRDLRQVLHREHVSEVKQYSQLRYELLTKLLMTLYAYYIIGSSKLD